MQEVRFAYSQADPLFDGLSLSVRCGGEIKCVLGPSGVGKSTLLQLAMGELQPDSGNVSTSGQFLPVLQDFESMILPWFSARTNIVWGLNSDADDELKRVANLLEIGEFLAALPRNLSGGQRQRIVFARALIRRPNLLLLDEPLANIDAGTERRLLPRIRAFLHENLVSALWVTHNVAEALAVADAVCVLHEGGVVHEFPVHTPGGDEALTAQIEKLLL